MKLWVRVTFVSSILIILVLTGVGGLLFFAEKWHLLENLSKQQDESVHRMAQVCIEAQAEQNDIPLINYVLSLSKDNPGIRYASYFNAAGKVIVHSNVSMIGQVLNDPTTLALTTAPGLLRQYTRGPKNEPILDIGLPVIHNGKKIGYARIGYDQRYFENQVEDTLNSAMVRFSYVFGAAIF